MLRASEIGDAKVRALGAQPGTPFKLILESTSKKAPRFFHAVVAVMDDARERIGLAA